MKKVVIGIKIVVFIALFIACGQFFRFILADDTASYTRIMMHEMYESEENIDVLFVGSSHCYFSFVPEITDEIFEKNTFNVGSSSQGMDASYELIREVNKRNDLQQVYLEVYYRMGASGENKDRDLMMGTNIISDYMKPSLRKYAFLLQASSNEHYVNSFIVARRDWEKLYDPVYMRDLVKKKLTDDYRDYKYTYVTDNGQAYQGKGYVTNNGVAPEYYCFQCWPIYVDGFSKDWENSLKKIISYCDKEGIELTLVSAPMPNFALAGMGNYDDYLGKVNGIIEGTGVNYYDFNFCKEEYIPNTSGIFRDTDHLNTEGAELFSTVFAKFFTGQIREEDLFYSSFNEKLSHFDPMILGLGHQDRASAYSDEIVRHLQVVSTRYEGIEYRIYLTPEGEETCMVQDFSENREFEIPLDSHGICTIEWKIKDAEEDTVQTAEIAY